MSFNSEMSAALIAGLFGYILKFDQDSILLGIIFTLVLFEGIEQLHRYLFKE